MSELNFPGADGADIKIGRGDCECGDKIGFHALERQLAEAMEKALVVELGLRAELKQAQGKLDAVERVGADYFRMGVGDVAFELRNAIHARILKGENDG